MRHRPFSSTFLDVKVFDCSNPEKTLLLDTASRTATIVVPRHLELQPQHKPQHKNHCSCWLYWSRAITQRRPRRRRASNTLACNNTTTTWGNQLDTVAVVQQLEELDPPALLNQTATIVDASSNHNSGRDVENQQLRTTAWERWTAIAKESSTLKKSSTESQLNQSTRQGLGSRSSTSPNDVSSQN